ncbi:MAG: ACT domain-containing protein [Opitutales bacterium]
MKLRLLTGEYAVCRLAPVGPVPAWAESAEFSSVTRTAEELSVLCPAHHVPAGVRHQSGWRLFKFAGPLAFTETGILAAVLAPLAAAKVSVLAQATFDTDYLLVKATDLDRTVAALTAAGHSVDT